MAFSESAPPTVAGTLVSAEPSTAPPSPDLPRGTTSPVTDPKRAAKPDQRHRQGKLIAARSSKPAQRFVPLPVPVGLLVTPQHPQRPRRSHQSRGRHGHEPVWRRVTRAGSGGGLAGDGSTKQSVGVHTHSLVQGSDQKYGAYHAIFGVSLTKPVTLSVTLIAYGSRFHAVQPTHTSALELM